MKVLGFASLSPNNVWKHSGVLVKERMTTLLGWMDEIIQSHRVGLLTIRKENAMVE